MFFLYLNLTASYKLDKLINIFFCSSFLLWQVVMNSTYDKFVILLRKIIFLSLIIIDVTQNITMYNGLCQQAPKRPVFTQKFQI